MAGLWPHDGERHHRATHGCEQGGACRRSALRTRSSRPTDGPGGSGTRVATGDSCSSQTGLARASCRPCRDPLKRSRNVYLIGARGGRLDEWDRRAEGCGERGAPAAVAADDHRCARSAVLAPPHRARRWPTVLARVGTQRVENLCVGDGRPGCLPAKLGERGTHRAAGADGRAGGRVGRAAGIAQVAAGGRPPVCVREGLEPVEASSSADRRPSRRCAVSTRSRRGIAARRRGGEPGGPERGARPSSSAHARSASMTRSRVHSPPPLRRTCRRRAGRCTSRRGRPSADIKANPSRRAGS